MLGRDVEDCREHIVYLKNNTRDIQTPIKVILIILYSLDKRVTSLAYKKNKYNFKLEQNAKEKNNIDTPFNIFFFKSNL